MGPPVQRARPGRPGVPPDRRPRPPFPPKEVERIVEAVAETRPAEHGLPGHGWTPRELKQRVAQALGRVASRGTIRRVPRRAKRTWKKVKGLVGEARPGKRAAHVQQLLARFAGVCEGDVTLIDVDEVHVHRDLGLGDTGGRRGQRLWRRSDCPGLSERMNACGAYDFTPGECLAWDGGRRNGGQAVLFLREVARWRAGEKGRVVVIWDNAPCHLAKVVTAEAARLGIEVVNLPGSSPDLDPIERLRDWMREDVTRGFCHASVAELVAAGRASVARINRNPVALIDRLWPKFGLDPEFEEKLRAST